MVLFWNVLPFLVFFVVMGIFLFTKNPKVLLWTVIVAVIFYFMYPKIQPSYLPKGDIARTEVPGFEPSKATIEDRNLKPESSESRQARQEKTYKDGFPK